MRPSRVVLVVALACSIGCDDDGFEDTSRAPACTDERGCPAGMRCVQGLYCIGEAPDGPVAIPPSPNGSADTPGGAIDSGSFQLDGGANVLDGGAGVLDGGRFSDGGVAPRFDGGRCVGAQVSCGGVCVDTQSDVQNCGGCGVACTGGDFCSGGVCCGALSDICGGSCVDLTTDPRNCGACEFVCPQGTECSLGACVEPLPGSAPGPL